MSGKEARLKKTGRGLPVIGRDSHVLSIIGLMILVCIIMMLLKPESYFTGLNLRSMIFQFPEYGVLGPGHDGLHDRRRHRPVPGGHHEPDRRVGPP